MKNCDIIDDKYIHISEILTPTDHLCLIISEMGAEIQIYVSVQLFSTPQGVRNVAFGEENHAISCDALGLCGVENS
jgi:hypothetical protein